MTRSSGRHATRELTGTTAPPPAGRASCVGNDSAGMHALGAKLPQAASRLDDARDDILAFAAFPREAWRQVWPSGESADSRRSISRRSMGPEILDACRKAAASKDPAETEDTSDAELRIEAIPAYIKNDRAVVSQTLELPQRCVHTLRLPHESQDKIRSGMSATWHDNEQVFCTLVGTALDAANVRRSFRTVIKAAGLKPADWAPRGLRHSFVSIMSDAGVPIERISRLIGHSGTTVTETVYRHQLCPLVQGGAEIMDRLFPATPPVTATRARPGRRTASRKRSYSAGYSTPAATRAKPA
jgi:hypothetical protein